MRTSVANATFAVLPRTLTEALDALQADAVLMAALGTELAQEYLIVETRRGRGLPRQG